MKKEFWAPLILSALFLLGGCGSAVPGDSLEPVPSREEQDAELRDALTGDWVCAELDVTERFAAGLDENLRTVCELPEVRAALELHLDAGGSFTLAYNEEDGRLAAERVRAALEDGIPEYLLQEIRTAYAEAGLTPEEVYAQYGADSDAAFLEVTMGMSLEELYEEMDLASLVEGLWEPVVSDGSWSVENGKLLLDGSEVLYDATEDTLMLTGQVYTRK